MILINLGTPWAIFSAPFKSLSDSPTSHLRLDLWLDHKIDVDTPCGTCIRWKFGSFARIIITKNTNHLIPVLDFRS
ncbi:MAG: hypothetical protein DSO08_03110 [Candidatus Methanomethylicota archaeon]|uniref:Uncharacterized protein n=1 Tax=Thermoproteota archaeon TaxID=2056631 RepID=A0A523BF37_9CREN|nr:MAG: hypothetical protein DSO08_03110 [Candidatus Verstraetearchaeota archaeon]